MRGLRDGGRAWLWCRWAAGQGGERGDAPSNRSATRHHWCGGCRRAWLQCPWAVAGPGRPSSQRAEPKARGADGERAGRRPRAHQAARPGRANRATRQGVRSKTSGTGRRHDPRLGRQGTQSGNPQRIRDVGGATRPGHSQGRPDKRNDVGGGPAQAS